VKGRVCVGRGFWGCCRDRIKQKSRSVGAHWRGGGAGMGAGVSICVGACGIGGGGGGKTSRYTALVCHVGSRYGGLRMGGGRSGGGEGGGGLGRDLGLLSPPPAITQCPARPHLCPCNAPCLCLL